MRIIIFLIIGFLFFNQTQAQTEKVEKLQSEIASLIGELKKETTVNYMKHFNQVEGFKHGLWIESTNGQIWFVNYDLGLKDGKTTIYYTSGKKHVEASYKQGFLIDTVNFYESNGELLRTYENINLCDTIVERKIEKAEGNKIYFTKEKHKFEYKAYIKKYDKYGILYAEGFALFDDEWIFHLYPVGEWKYPEEYE